MSIRPRYLSTLACLLLGLSFGVSAQTLRLHGSNTIGARLAPALLEAWARSKGYGEVRRSEGAAQEYDLLASHPAGGRFLGQVRAHGTGTGLSALLGGEADIWMASRAVTDDELARAHAAAGPLRSPAQEHVIALDGLAIIVHPDNPLRELRIEQVREAFAGRVSDWSQLGGRPGPIVLHARDDRSGTWDTFKSLVLADGAPLAASARRFESSAELEREVAADPAALGFVGVSYVSAARALAVRADADAGALQPDALAISTEDYPLARRLYFYSARGARAEVAEFIEFVQGSGGQAVVAANGFVAQQIFATASEPGTGRPAGYYDVTRDAARVSLNFRFRPASSTLDNRALRDIERLRDFMQQPRNRGREVRLAAFSYGHAQTPVMALLTLNDRVDHIAQLLATRGVSIGASRGFVDPAAPAAALRDERVEVWIGAAPAAYGGDGAP